MKKLTIYYFIHIFLLYLIIMVDKERKAIIKNSDMTEDMQQDAINVATKAIDSYNIEKGIAAI